MLYHGEKLVRVDSRLVRVLTEVAQHRDCIVLIGDRPIADERAAILAGTSHLTNPLDSLHVTDPVKRPLALAADVAPFPLDWENTRRFDVFAGYVYAIADDLGIVIRWGGDWDGPAAQCCLNKPGQLNDLDHFELPQ